MGVGLACGVYCGFGTGGLIESIATGTPGPRGQARARDTPHTAVRAVVRRGLPRATGVPLSLRLQPRIPPHGSGNPGASDSQVNRQNKLEEVVNAELADLSVLVLHLRDYFRCWGREGAEVGAEHRLGESDRWAVCCEPWEGAPRGSCGCL